MICNQSGGKYRAQRFDCVVGQLLTQQDISRTGIYAVISSLNGVVLRVPMFKELAEMYRDNSRNIAEAFLIPL